MAKAVTAPRPVGAGAQKKAQRHEYYLRNREKIVARAREHRRAKALLRGPKRVPLGVHASRLIRNRAIKAEVDAIKARTPCADCRRSYPPECIDFDHVRGKKRAGVSELVNSKCSRRAILLEITKCDVVCANCHRVRTKRRILEHMS